MPPKKKKTAGGDGGSLSTAAQNVVRRVIKATKVPTLRMLGPEEGPHWPSHNFTGPGTDPKVLHDGTPPTSALDNISRLHDLEYERIATTITDPAERMQAYHKADEEMIERINQLPASERGFAGRIIKMAISGKAWVEKNLVGRALHDPTSGGAVQMVMPGRPSVGSRRVANHPVHKVDLASLPRVTFTGLTDLENYIKSNLSAEIGSHPGFKVVMDRLKSDPSFAASMLARSKSDVLTVFRKEVVDDINESNKRFIERRDKLEKFRKEYTKLKRDKDAPYSKLGKEEKSAITKELNRRIAEVNDQIDKRKTSVEHLTGFGSDSKLDDYDDETDFLKAFSRPAPSVTVAPAMSYAAAAVTGTPVVAPKKRGRPPKK